jgi:hypothetical protein
MLACVSLHCHPSLIFAIKALTYLREATLGWEETNPSNICEHLHTDIRNNAISIVPRGKKQMSVQKIQMLVRLFFHPLTTLMLATPSV